MTMMTQLAQPLMHRVRHIHFIGIGGVGMCGIAEVLHNEGYTISGSDLSASETTERLTSIGVRCFIGHDAKQIANADVIVVSTAINPDNVEIQAARVLHIPIVTRADMLGELMRFRFSIAIAGTHGKTTTTSLVTSVLSEGGQDPTLVIGGQLNQTKTHAKLGSGPYLVAEADESDASFLNLFPMMAVVTNIDEDHMETYNNDFNVLLDAFNQFLHRLPFYGVAVMCIDCETTRKLAEKS